MENPLDFYLLLIEKKNATIDVVTLPAAAFWEIIDGIGNACTIKYFQ